MHIYQSHGRVPCSLNWFWCVSLHRTVAAKSKVNRIGFTGNSMRLPFNCPQLHTDTHTQFESKCESVSVVCINTKLDIIEYLVENAANVRPATQVECVPRESSTDLPVVWVFVCVSVCMHELNNETNELNKQNNLLWFRVVFWFCPGNNLSSCSIGSFNSPRRQCFVVFLSCFFFVFSFVHCLLCASLVCKSAILCVCVYVRARKLVCD